MTPYIWQKDNLINALQTLNPAWQGQFELSSTRIVTDTRKIEQGDIFLAIKGENFDGHDYVSVAQDKGAVLAIVSRHVPCELPQLLVNDTKLALGQLGKYRRDCHPNLQVVALTGSSGKTTSKEMLGSILNQIAPTLITRGNLNNDLGVPMMLLELCDEHRFAVIELGANHIGEIAYTTGLVSPDVACVLNIGTAHLGEFGGRDNIAKTKAEIFEGLTAEGVAVLPFGDDYFDELLAKANEYTPNYLTFGEQSSTYEKAGLPLDSLADSGLSASDTVLIMGDVFADDIVLTEFGSRFEMIANPSVDSLDETVVELPFMGEHNVNNALAMSACALALGVPLDKIAKGLKNATPPKGRLTLISFGEHLLIDDTYNANPNSILAAAGVLEQKDGQKILVLGDIGELGEQADNEHFALGQKLAGLHLDKILSVGTHMAQMAKAVNDIRPDLASHFDNKAELLICLKQHMAMTSSCVLFKGSRTAKMESVIAELMADNLGSA